MTLEGTLAAVPLLVRKTVRPPDGATLDSVTVPVAVVPPTTLPGLTASAARGGLVTVSVAVRVVVPWLAAMVSAVSAATATVVTGKVAVVAPAATVTPAGTFAAGLPLESVTASLPAGTGVRRVTVPVEEAPPETWRGSRATAESRVVGGVSVGEALRDPRGRAAVTVTFVGTATAAVVTANAAASEPAGMVTLPGTAATVVSLLESGTTTPFAGAGLDSDRVPHDGPATRDAGRAEHHRLAEQSVVPGGRGPDLELRAREEDVGRPGVTKRVERGPSCIQLAP